MQVRLLTKTQGLEGTEYFDKSIDEIIVGKARASSSRDVNELFEEPHKLLRHCILNGHWCFDKDTEILTSDGFKNIQYVSELNQVACYNKDTDTVYFDYPSHRNKQKYTGEMIGFKNRYIDFLVTPNHRIPVFNKKGQTEVLEAQTIFNNKRRSSNLICFAKQTIASIQANPFTNYNKRIMSLIGFFIGDGSVKTSNHGIVFHLTVERKIEYLKNICKELNLTLNIQGDDHYIVKSLELKNIFTSLFQTSSGEKTIPRVFTTLETELKDLLLEGLVNSDGYFNKGSLIYDTTSEDLVDSLQAIFCISGYKITVSKRKRESLNHKERYRLYFSKKQYTTEKKGVQGGWYIEGYDDYVYCLSVPTQFLVIRRNNKVSISGNSIFDQCHLGFEIKTSRAMGRELLRHSSIHPQEFSQRYAEVYEYEPVELRIQSKSNRQSSTELYLSEKEIKDSQCTAKELLNIGIQESFDDYQGLLAEGIAKECARFILPECTSTTLHMEGSIRSWITLLNVRLHQTAQKEIRLIAEDIRDIFIVQCPIISSSLFNFEDAYNIHILERVVLEKYGLYSMIKNNNFKKIKT